MISGHPTLRSKILKYLKTHGDATEKGIAEALHLSVEDVLNMLEKLENEGIVLRTQTEEK